MYKCFVVLLSLILARYSNDVIIPQIEKDDYRVALYSMEIDYTKGQQFVPEMQYMITDLSTVSYLYFIQYGKDIFIEILDPGNEIKSFKGCIRKLDYSKRKSMFTCMIDQSKTYHTTEDTITYLIEESRGSIAYIYKGVGVDSKFDTVKYVLHAIKRNYTVILNDTIPNLRSSYLFYPDIEYLPYKIIGLGRNNNNTMTLEKVMYGKSTVDSLLQLYEYQNYTEITDDETNPDHRQLVIDLIEKLEKEDK